MGTWYVRLPRALYLLGPEFLLIIQCHHLEILNNFEQVPYFHFTLSPTNYVTQTRSPKGIVIFIPMIVMYR